MGTPPPTNHSSRPIRRSCSVTLIALMVLIIAGWNLVRLVSLLSQWSFLRTYAEIPLLYLALSRLFWFLIGLIVGWGMWRSKPWSVRATKLFSLLYVLCFWIERLVVRRISVPGNGFLLAAIMIFWLGFVFFALRFHRLDTQSNQ